MKKNTSTLKKIFGYIGHYKYLLFLSVLLAGASVVLTLYVPIRIGYAIDAIIGPGQVDFTVVARHLIAVVVMLLCVGLMQWVMNMLNNKITYNVVRDMRARAFDKLLVLPFSYLDSHSQGDVVSRVISDADQFADGLLMGFSQLFTGVLSAPWLLCCLSMCGSPWWWLLSRRCPSLLLGLLRRRRTLCFKSKVPFAASRRALLTR